MFRNTGEIGFPIRMLAYRLNISFVAKSTYYYLPAQGHIYYDAAIVLTDYFNLFKRNKPTKLDRSMVLINAPNRQNGGWSYPLR